ATKGLELAVDIQSSVPLGIHGDRLRIGQILTNLLSNAIKFTEQGRVSVSASVSDELAQTLCITVSDTGIGLEDEVQDKLFQAFSQADNSTSRIYGGTGLGLSISKQLAQLMGGEIGVKSVAGIGSQFWFTVVYQPATGPVTRTYDRTTNGHWCSSRPLKILVAEDTELLQQITTAILEDLNHQVVIAHNGKVAVDKVAVEHFDLILMDIRMPVMDGMAATRIIRAMSDDRATIPIIALTADIAAGNIHEYIQSGVNEVCAKPINLNELLRTINTQLKEVIHVFVDNKVSGFGQVTKHVILLADKNPASQTTSPLLAAKLPKFTEQQLADLRIKYESTVTQDCVTLQNQLKTLAKNPADAELIKAMGIIPHTHKGTAYDFDYRLITTVATQANVMLNTIENFSANDIQNLGNHIAALSLIVEYKMTGDGGEAGRELLQGLKDCAVQQTVYKSRVVL
ncbi:MAG: response regulator, partial [Algicola sp.]|nr:response regulator [Algicola sp.]